ncbi:Protein N-acetyltransferase, RimJ/RimL family [Sinosporangium album]|uniref:Protein N-acetyltransferase, RimJ/RimL family n=1 Tax=Sinosporangium album TaxID=504805 RepID=A0A1G8IBF0_9ACTN|nr:GNAT family protein [Sinosporangium album]SDI16213.1 Protein N-acetyltransferase, RimJ/RimL family [Sinosporangium album]
MHSVHYSGVRLRLREVTPDDVDALLAIYGDPAATQHLPFNPRTRDEVEEIIAKAVEAAAARPRHRYLLAVIDNDTARLIGVGRLLIDPEYPHSAEIGVGLRPDQWGRGMGTDLLRLILEFGFRRLGLHRLWGSRSPANTGAQLAMLVAGMVEEGRLRHHVATPTGWRDSIIHSAIRTEWDRYRSN